jgi:C_GCAxxG_C_C family probable redox protein
MNNVDLALKYFKDDGYACSQAVFATFAEKLGLNREKALKIADAFGAGMGGMAETCGAVTGAVMVFGLKYGREKADDKPAKEKTRELVKKFAAEFKARNRSTICRELLGCDISSPAGMKQADELGLFKTRCPGFVRDAAEIVEKLL